MYGAPLSIRLCSLERVLGGENKSYQHVVMAAQAFDSAIRRMLTRALIKPERS